MKTVAAALLAPADFGAGWVAATPPQNGPLDPCLGGGQIPPPGQPQVTVLSARHQVSSAARTVAQTLLIYPDASAATSAMETMQTAARACPTSTAVPRRLLPDTKSTQEAFQQTIKVDMATANRWKGFTLTRDRVYDGGNGMSNEAQAVRVYGNTVLVADFNDIYSDPASADAGFGAWRQSIVDKILDRAIPAFTAGPAAGTR